MLKPLLAELVAGRSLTAQQAQAAFEGIMTGQVPAAQTGAMLAMMQMRGPTVDELTGAARVMRDKVARVQVPAGLTAIDTCGTGGDHAETFNISTAAALVAAGAGLPRGAVVAKHGNRSVTSKSGSSQVLETLGVELACSSETLTQCLREAGLCFCFAPAHHPAMKHAMPIRQELGFRTIFNLLGPLTNPAGAARQVVGVFDEALTEPIAQVLCALGAEHAMVVHGSGLDEITIAGPTRISHLRHGKVKTETFDPAELGIARQDLGVLKVAGPEASAAVIRSILDGEKGAARDIVLLNAAAALVVADLAENLAKGLALAAESVDSGAANRALAKLVQLTNA